MNSINEEVLHEIEIKKSRFICYLKYITSVKEAKDYIEKIQIQNEDATHNCSAYRIGTIEKADDDGEPTGTAGLPILNVLQKHELNSVVCVVTRYFGGIKLGASGLIRAYAKSTSEGIKQTQLVKVVPGQRILIKVDFTFNDNVKYFLDKNKITINSISYEQKVVYEIEIKTKQKEYIENKIKRINHLIVFESIERVMVKDEEIISDE